MSLIGTRTRKHNVLRNESGQAVLEYILVLAITIIIIGSLLYQFSTAFRKYANNYFGNYIACLMETGELPGQTGGACAAEWTPFNYADGKTASGKPLDLSDPSGSGSGGSSSSSSGSSGSGKNSSKSPSKSASSGSSPSSSDSSSSASSSGPTGELVGSTGSGGGGSGYNSRSRSRRSTPVASTASAGQDGSGREGLKAIGKYTGSSSSSREGTARRRVLSREFGYAGQEQDQKRELDRPATKSVGKDDSESSKPKKTTVQPPRAPAAASDGGDTSFTVGNFLRILLIAAILIAIFVVFGGQLLAISKGGEK